MTINNISPAGQAFVNGINQISQKLSTATQEISSGLKLTTAADDPAQVNDLLQLRADRQLNTQIASNLTMANSIASAADTAIGSSIQLINTAIQVGTQAANSLTSQTTDTSLAVEVQGMLTQMVNYSQSQVQGQYIFSGDQPGSPAYGLNSAAAKGVDQLLTVTATQQVQDPAGGSFAASKTAQQVFDTQNADGTPATDNAFAALHNLIVALQTGDTTGIQSSLANLQAASKHLNAAQSFYGVVENRIQTATSYSTSHDTQLQTQIGSIQDADTVSDALVLAQSNTQLQAAFAAQSQIPKSTLFNYLT